MVCRVNAHRAVSSALGVDMNTASTGTASPAFLHPDGDPSPGSACSQECSGHGRSSPRWRGVDEGDLTQCSRFKCPSFLKTLSVSQVI